MLNTKSVLFVHKDFPIGGGVERVSINLARQFRDDGHQVCFFVGGGPDEGSEALAREFDVVHASGGVVKRVFKLYDLIKSRGIQCAVSSKEQANVLLWLVSMLSHSFVPVFARHCAFDVSDQKLSPRMIGVFYNLYALGRGRIVAVSNALSAEIERALWVGKAKLNVCANPVVAPGLFELAATNSEGFSHPRPYICGVGRLCEQKGFDQLLVAYAEVKGKVADYPDLLLVGDGPDRQALEAQAAALGISKAVRFTGFTCNPYYVIKGSEAFVLSSRHEGLPTVLIEALALGRPVVAFDCPTGPREILCNGDYGYLVPNGDVSALASAMQAVMHDARHAPASAVAPYSYQAAASAYYHVFSS